MKLTRNSLTPALAAVVVGATGLVVRPALSVESVVVRIDNTVVQPVSTGLVLSGTGNLIFITEGNLQPFPTTSRLTDGNFGPDGETKLQRAGQPIVDGMPYGALVGRIGSGTLPNFQFLGATGIDDVTTSNTGELRLALNMSDTDLAGMAGEVVVTAIFVPEGSQDVAEIELDASSAYPLPTGLIAESGDEYAVLAAGTVRHPTVAHDEIVDGWFGPAGKLMFNRTGQPEGEGPYGAVYGTYSTATQGFYLGSAGTWSAQPAEIGRELSVFLNMSEADHSVVEGSIKVWVVRMAEVPAGADDDLGQASVSRSGYPTPTSGPVRIRYSVPVDGDVLVRVYDAAGREVSTLVDEPIPAGVYDVQWNTAETGAPIASGTYFYQVTTRTGTEVGRIVVAK